MNHACSISTYTKGYFPPGNTSKTRFEELSTYVINATPSTALKIH